MTSSNGNIFCITGPLCVEFTGHRWIPLCCFYPLTAVSTYIRDLNLDNQWGKSHQHAQCLQHNKTSYKKKLAINTLQFLQQYYRNWPTHYHKMLLNSRWIPLRKASDAVIFSLTCAWTNGWVNITCFETAVRWMSQNLTNGNSTLVQVMA